MKPNWEVEELIEHWTLLPSEMTLLRNKRGAKRLGFAICLKYFQLFTKFPDNQGSIPDAVIAYIATQVNVSPSKYEKYDWHGRSSRYHRNQIRDHFGFRLVQELDLKKLKNWLVSEVLFQEHNREHLIEITERYFQEKKIEQPTEDTILRLIGSASRQFEDNLFETINTSLSEESRLKIDSLIETSNQDNEDKSNWKPSLFSYLNSEPRRASLESFLNEITKLEHLREIQLPENLFENISPKVLQTYAGRA